MRGCKYEIQDGLFHQDPVHRGVAQVMPAARRVFLASQLTAKPALQEPIFMVEIQAPDDLIGSVF